jgi:inhibitor of KinA sporulation pathway (predicted exonuclease)
MDLDITQLAKRVASAHLQKMAFNKENVSDLLRQLVKILDKASDEAEGQGRKGLQDASSRVKTITKVVDDAWNSRKEE